MTYYHRIIPSPVGKLTLIADDKALCALVFENGKHKAQFISQPAAKHPVLDRAEKQLAEYFRGARTAFDLPLAFHRGTEFQKKAWRALTRIPYGKTVSYREQAKMLGDIKKARPIGQANGKNPIAIIVPCHRVIGASGSLTGYGGGLKTKEFLLGLEQRAALKQAA
jgi:methylated-DNA-[protein]-cysteine S-methyltransferase